MATDVSWVFTREGPDGPQEIVEEPDSVTPGCLFEPGDPEVGCGPGAQGGGDWGDFPPAD